MKYIFYVILLFIVFGCLFYSPKRENYFTVQDKKPNMALDFRVEESTKTNNSITIKWTSPGNPVVPPTENEDTSIQGYIIMLKKNNSTTDNGIYMKIYADSEAQSCNSCEYKLTNLSLESNTNYTINIMAFNKIGTGPIARTSFQSLSSPSPSPSTSPSPTPSSSLNPSSSSKLDQYVNNMVLRADGLYDWDNTIWKYPDTYNYDVKQSLTVLNDQLKKDLQEYRVNVHIGTSQN